MAGAAQALVLERLLLNHPSSTALLCCLLAAMLLLFAPVLPSAVAGTALLVLRLLGTAWCCKCSMLRCRDTCLAAGLLLIKACEVEERAGHQLQRYLAVQWQQW